jgi:LysR family transcriptional regulator for bpeEF and oprC
MSTSLDLNRVQLFREVVLAGSFSKAAARMRMPKSRVSRTIAALEHELGVQLIYRTTRQFRLTQTGNELFQKTAPLIEELRSSLIQVSSQSEEISGMIKISVSEDVGSELMAKICADFMKTYPKVEIGLHAANQLVNLVKDSIDIAVRMGPSRDSSMMQRKIGSVGLILVASPGFLERSGGVTRLEQLEALPHLAFSPPGIRRHTLRLSNGKETRSLRMEAAFSCNNFFTLRGMALEGMGVARIPAFLAKEQIELGSLVHLFKDWTLEKNPVLLLTPQQKEQPARIRAFLDFLAARIPPLL